MSNEPGFASLKGQGIFFSEGARLALYAIVGFVTYTETDFFLFCISGRQNVNSRVYTIIFS